MNYNNLQYSEKELGKRMLLWYFIIYFFGGGLIALFVESIIQVAAKYYEYIFLEPITETLIYNSLVNLLVYVTFMMVALHFYRKVIIQHFEEVKENKFLLALVPIAYVILLIVGYTSNVIVEALGVTDANNQVQVVELIKTYPYLMFPVTCIMAPIVEELVFRKAIFDVINKTVVAVIISALSFGLLHVLMSLLSGDYMDMINIISYGSMGLVFALLYVYSKKNINVVIWLHMLQNMVAFIVIFFRK